MSKELNHEAFRSDSNDELEELFDVEGLEGSPLDRAELLRGAAKAGVTLSALAALFPGVAGATTARTARIRGQRGGTLRLAFQADTSVIEPFQVSSDSAYATLQQIVEPLVWSNADLVPRPLLAQSFAAVGNAKTWRFNLRQNVRYSNGTQFTADDVVTWFNKLVAEDSTSPAKGALTGVLSPGNIEKVDPYTVVFHLDRPVSSFPMRVSNYVAEAGIPPKTYEVGTFAQNPIGTGPFMLTQFTPRQSITLVRNPNYWQTGLPYLDGLNVRDLELASQVIAMQAGDLDLMPQAPLAAAQALLNNSKFVFSFAPSAGYRSISMRVDRKPFNDKRVRQAVAYCVDRNQLVQGLLKGYGQIGNDHAFAPVYKLGIKLPQRKQDYTKARQLLTAAGYPQGFSVKLTAQNDQELPQYAAILQQMVRPAGIRMSLNILSDAAFYGAPGKAEPWLNDIMVGTPWNSRPTPSQLLLTAYLSSSPWNAAHWRNRRFTSLASAFDAAVDPGRRRVIAQQMAQIQNDEVPSLFAYWIQQPRVRTQQVQGLPLTSTVHVDARRVSLA